MRRAIVLAALAALAASVAAPATAAPPPPPPPVIRTPPPPPVIRTPPPPPGPSSKPSLTPSKPATGDKGALRGTGAGKPGGGLAKLPTAAKPSTGPKAQPAPLKRIVPPPPKPPRVGSTSTSGSFLARSPQTARTVLGQGNRDWQRDSRLLQRNPQYGDPYYRGRGATDGVTNVYMGDPSSSLFYLYAGAMLFNPPSERPLPPQSEDEVSMAIPSLLGVIEAERKAIAAKAKEDKSP